MFIFNKLKDNKGNDYLNCFSNIETNSVIAINGKNILIRGNPKIQIRTGTSNYGKELLFTFLIKEKIQEYPTNSKYETIEYYLPAKEGIEFLQQALEFLKKELIEGEQCPTK